MTGGNSLGCAVVRWLPGNIIKHPSRGWALRRNLLVHGLDDPMNLLSVAPDFTLKGRAQMIQCPTFVCTAEHDDLSLKGASALYEALICPKQFVLFKAADGAGDHCEMAARTLFHQEAFDWPDEVLARKPVSVG
jgi:hypothetical protein